MYNKLQSGCFNCTYKNFLLQDHSCQPLNKSLSSFTRLLSLAPKAIKRKCNLHGLKSVIILNIVLWATLPSKRIGAVL
ncbi:hypothetical protein CISIN_1g047973mg [Citrus sinensis]|uniref:Uncharacterized protein n=1 Tax=Citrus sinensis TaxID=2711 RepID=A0A067DZS0_CITSI|nr:hypothetical protein CISIN_1g047973mg [Citrus sinensis]